MEEKDRPGLVFCNLASFIILGVALSFWMLRYTDWFPVFGGILGLSGAFAWIAFLSNLITEGRKKAAQQYLDQRILQNKGTLLALVGLILVFIFGFAFWHGTLLIDTQRGFWAKKDYRCCQKV